MPTYLGGERFSSTLKLRLKLKRLFEVSDGIKQDFHKELDENILQFNPDKVLLSLSLTLDLVLDLFFNTTPSEKLIKKYLLL